MPIVSGGFGLFRRDAVIQIGGYRHGHLGEDMDMCLRIQREMADRGEPRVVIQVPESICWTEFPSTKEVLRRQRIRWHRGLGMIISDHGSMVGRRRYGSVGSVGVGSLYLFEWIGPVLEAIGWAMIAALVCVGWVNPTFAVALFITTQLFGMVMTMIGVSMMTKYLHTFNSRRDLRWLIGWSVATNWGYRQLTLVWRIRSLFPGSTGWGEMPRTGFSLAPVPVPA
jgi:cellulose synthase/poly-beta-1,6-N-acetylglucosamine synthase-like glycosyltransferase